jgi:hypothetical protein
MMHFVCAHQFPELISSLLLPQISSTHVLISLFVCFSFVVKFSVLLSSLTQPGPTSLYWCAKAIIYLGLQSLDPIGSQQRAVKVAGISARKAKIASQGQAKQRSRQRRLGVTVAGPVA